MDDTFGFELIEARDVDELRSRARLYRHRKTGAELLSVENDEEDKVFGVAFRTVPEDSTGAAHILEHVALAGSEKYPIKEPFVELLKGSLASFVNAMTFPDRTVYPVASQNLADFYNLIDVYLDAVFHPLLQRKTFKQEGWHYELQNLDGELKYKGVVFNEMKGSLSSVNSILYRETLRNLFPDTTYSFSAAGDPSEIPDLTFEEFRAFYDLHYHPTNARFFFFGDDPPDQRLSSLARVLEGYEDGPRAADVPLQRRFSKPEKITVSCPLREDGEGEEKHVIGVNWMLGEAQNAEELLTLEILSHILMGTSASTLRKELIESELGEEIFGTGYNFGDGTDLRQMTFTCGLRGVPKGNVDRVEELILESISAIVRDGIERDLITASLNTVEFQLRESNFGGLPRGIGILMRILPGWIHGGDPIDGMAYLEPLRWIKKRVDDSSAYFEEFLMDKLVANPHRVTLHLAPEKNYLKELDAVERTKLDDIQAALQDSELEEILENTETLQEWQGTPDRPEDLAKIPILAKDDLDRKVKTIPIEIIEENESRILYHDLPTSGIGYFDIGFNLRSLPLHLLPYVPLFGRALVGMGTEREDYVQLSLRIGKDTGGIRSSSLATGVYCTDRLETWMFLRGKALISRTPALLDIFKDVLQSPRFDQQDRFRQIALQDKARIEAGILQSGHQVVNHRLRAGLSEAGWVEEQFVGLEQLFFIRDLIARIESDWSSVVADLEMIHTTLVNRGLMLFNLTMEETDRKTIWGDFSTFLASLPSIPAKLPEWKIQLLKGNEGLIAPSQVNYVGQGLSLFSPGGAAHGSWFVANGYLRSTWLWENVRLMGGAYGAFVVLDSLTGVFSQLSYRDPNILPTLETFDGSVEFLASIELDETELLKSVIGAVGRMDAYQLPDAKGFTSMTRTLSGLTDPVRQRVRDELLGTTAKDFRALGETLRERQPVSRTVVLGARENIEEASKEKAEEWIKLIQVM